MVARDLETSPHFVTQPVGWAGLASCPSKPHDVGLAHMCRLFKVSTFFPISPAFEANAAHFSAASLYTCLDTRAPGPHLTLLLQRDDLAQSHAWLD
jgi:hypothetical protein